MLLDAATKTQLAATRRNGRSFMIDGCLLVECNVSVVDTLPEQCNIYQYGTTNTVVAAVKSLLGRILESRSSVSLFRIRFHERCSRTTRTTLSYNSSFIIVIRMHEPWSTWPDYLSPCDICAPSRNFRKSVGEYKVNALLDFYLKGCSK